MGSLYRKYPRTVKALCQSFNGWIIGGAAEWASGKQGVALPNDIDIIIPYLYWDKATNVLPLTSVINSFGGFKFVEEFPEAQRTGSTTGQDGIEVDVWCDDVANVIALSGSKAFHPLTKTLLAPVKKIDNIPIGTIVSIKNGNFEAYQ